MTDATPPNIQLTAEERGNLWFIPQAPGGKVVAEAMQQRFQDLGLATAPDPVTGIRWITMLGDKVRRGAA